MSKFIPIYDLESLNEQQRQDYVKAVCEHMGVPSNLNLVMLAYLDEQDGPRRLVAYAKRGATEIVRDQRGINVTDLTSKEVGGSIVFTATGKDSKGRQEMSTGAKFIAGLTGKDLDDAIMTAQTRATRRMTLQFIGAGILDESEVNPKNTVELKNTTPVIVPPQPTVTPSTAPGKDITALASTVITHAPEGDTVVHTTVSEEEEKEKQAAFEAQQRKMREDAIAQLNAKSKTEETPKRKTRSRKVELGPSSPVPTAPVAVAQPQATPPPAPVAAPAPTVQVTPPTPAPSGPPVSVASKLTPDELKPFRQRQFKVITELELAGFAPKEGVGNLDKMRGLVGLMFPEVSNFNQLTAAQWEQYLNTVEGRLKKDGAAATIKWIEDSNGL